MLHYPVGLNKKERMTMDKRFVIGYDGFLRREAMQTFEQAKASWLKDIQNRFLYEYDCSVYELNEDGSINRRVSYEELKS
jgi:hypothetical protein